MNLNPNRIKEVVIIVIFSRLLIFLIAVLSDCMIADCQFPFQTPHVDIPVFGLFAKWDSFYYLDIATHGYSLKTDLWAFRPFYPIMLWLIGSPFTWYLGKWESFLIAGLIWNMFAFVLAVVYLYKLTTLILSEEHAYQTILLLSLFPSSVFFTAIYPESTYLLLTVASFYYLEKDKFFRAIILAALAGFTRPEGLLIFIPFLLKALNLKGSKKLELLIGSAIIVYTLPAFMLYGYIITDDPYIPFKAETQWPKATLYNLLTCAYREELVNESVDRLAAYFISTIILIIAIFSILILLPKFRNLKDSLWAKLMLIWRDKKMPYYAWAISLLGALLFQGGYAGLPRFASTLFPILWGNTIWINKRQLRTHMLLSFYTCLMTLGTALFVNWYYFL
ncbi:MAG: mannosyltransferase family protein [Candidatus Bathyarchaeia archaeon]